MEKYKKFDKALYDKNDQKAKQAAIKYLNQHGFVTKENEDRYGPDLIMTKNGRKYYVEVEIKHAWKGNKFQYSDLQIPERKRKFTGLDHKTFFMVFNETLTEAFFCSEKVLLESPTENVKNVYMDEEDFFKVPISKLIKLKMV